MLKVALVGCGKIADAHASCILMIEDCRLVGACDKEELMARQFRDRYPVDGIFGDLDEMIDKARPDVVHITTSPQSHFAIAKKCMERGCHVYVEKPFTIDAAEAEELVGLAERTGMKLTVGHDYQFSPPARRLRTMVKAGYLGGPPVHMESYYGYEMSGAYANALIGDKKHWVRALPGQLLQNIISHGIARISEYLRSDSPEVIAHGFASPYLRALGEDKIVDELRVIVSENRNTTAYFTFSSQMRPSLHQFRVYGPKNGLVLDHDNQTLIRLRGKAYVSYAEKFIPSINFSRQYLSNFTHNARLFMGRKFQMKAGMKWLIESFYASIMEDKSLPIPYREIILTSRIMDRIFDQVRSPSLRAPKECKT
jgi:predicted dehydrogenase